MKKGKMFIVIVVMVLLSISYCNLSAAELEKKAMGISQKQSDEEKTNQNLFLKEKVEVEKENADKDKEEKTEEKKAKEDQKKEEKPNEEKTEVEKEDAEKAHEEKTKEDKENEEKAAEDKDEEIKESVEEDSKEEEKKDPQESQTTAPQVEEKKEIFDYSAVHFTDIKESDWFYYAAYYCRNYRLIRGGYSAEFQPYSPVNREMFALILWRLDREPKTDAQYQFSDLKNPWTKEAISWAVSNGLFTPYPDNTFRPEKLINTQECINVLYRYTKYKNIDPGQLTTDFFSNPHYSKTDRYAWESLNWAISRNILPLEGDKFDSKKKLSRAKLCYIIRRYNEIVFNKNQNLEAIYVGNDLLYPSKTFVNKDGILINQITNLVTSRGKNINNFGIFIENIVSGEQFTYNPDTVFVAASTYKLPLAMVVYDKIREGNLKLSDTFQFYHMDLEYGGPTTGKYRIGSSIPVEELLSDMILYSDNTAARILFRSIGGWNQFHSLANKYSKDVDYYQLGRQGNYINARFSHDCLKYLYVNSDLYPKLLNDLKRARGYFTGSGYGKEIAQKWGAYSAVKHCDGIVYSDTPYIIVIKTKDTYDEYLFQEINNLVYRYIQE